MTSSRLTFYAFIISTVSVLGDGPFATIDLAVKTSDFSRYYGSTGTGDSGIPVCGGLDCDGDGFKDVAFAQIKAAPLVPPESSPRSGAGEVTLVFGNGSIGTDVDTAGFSAGILKIAGAQDGETAGTEIWMGDVNGDGLGDLMIGRQNYDRGARTNAGALTIVFGHADIRTWAGNLGYLDLGNLPTNQGAGILTIVGAKQGDRLGIWMRAGDVNGDGIDDIVVGADQMFGDGVDHAGGVYVIQGGTHLTQAGGEVDLGDFGGSGFPLSMQTRVALVRPPVGSSHYHFGSTVTVGDIDGNGRSEVVASAALNRAGASIGGDGSGGTSDGSMFIAWDENFPPGPWPNGYTFQVTSPLLGDFTRIDGEAVNRSFGEELLCGEDYSGDGFPDLAVGDIAGTAPGGRFTAGLGYLFYNAAKLRGRHFSMNSPPADVAFTKVYGPLSGAISSDTMAHGDFDNDGIADLVIGNPHDAPQGRSMAGSMHVLYGQPGGWPALIDLKSLSLPSSQEMRVLEIDGGQANDVLCYSAATGFINDDVHIDLIVNEMTGNGSGGTPVDVGNMLVISGAWMGSAPASDLSFTEGRLIDFGVIDLATTVTLDVEVVSASNATGFLSLTPTIAGPESGSYTVTNAVTTPANTRKFTIAYTPTAAGPHGAAIVLAPGAPALPIRLALRGIGRTALCLECDFTSFGESTLVRFPSALGIEYEGQRNGGLDANQWLPLGSLQSGTGGPIYLHDATVTPATPRAFYKIQIPPNP